MTVPSFVFLAPATKPKGAFGFDCTVVGIVIVVSGGDATDENVPGMCCEKVSAAAEGIVVRAEVAVAAVAAAS